MTPSREMIAAYADGELEGDALHEIEAAIAADPLLQAQVDAHRALRARLSAHFEPIVASLVPERLEEAVRQRGEAKVLDFVAARGRARATAPALRWSRFAGPALAASLVLALVGIGLSQEGAEGYAQGQLAAALETQLVEAQSQQAPFRILLSFRDREGHICRGFSGESRSGIACRDDKGWELAKVLGGEKAATEDYRQAGSADAQVLTAIQDLAQGPALDAHAERTAMRRGWQD